MVHNYINNDYIIIALLHPTLLKPTQSIAGPKTLKGTEQQIYRFHQYKELRRMTSKMNALVWLLKTENNLVIKFKP